MVGLLKRNLKLYLGDHSGVFFSCMGALIAFVLYIIFLKHNMVLSWHNIPHQNELLDQWLIGGTLATTAITTTGHAVSLAVTDRENGRLVDLMLTDVHHASIQVAYALNGIIIGMMMQFGMFVGLSLYFQVTDHVAIDWTCLPQLLMIMLLNAILWTAFNILIQTFVRKMSTLSTLYSLIGTAAGFFVGVYMPIGLLPKAAQQLIEWTPAPYSASLYRRVLMKKTVQLTFSSHPAARLNFEKTMGIGINFHWLTTWQTDTIILGVCALGFALIAGILASRSQFLAIREH